MKCPIRVAGLLILAGAFAVAARGAELVWVELVTSGAPASTAPFYEKVFGWTSERVGEGDWAPVVFKRGGVAIAGASHREGERMAKARARWVGFFPARAGDAGATDRAVGSAGGRVVEHAHAGAGAGVKATLFADREGAVFGVLQQAEGARRGGAATGFWPVMLAQETPAAAKFYRDVLGGEIISEGRTPLFPGDFLLTSKGTTWAGVQPAGVGARPGWLILIGVPDIEATVKTARRAGARLYRAPVVDLIGGRVAVLADPMGGVFGLYESLPLRSGAEASREAKPKLGGAFEVETLSR